MKSEKLKVKSVKYEPTVSVSTKKSGDKILISVKDNGDGIPASTSGNSSCFIFSAFCLTSSITSKSGAIVRRLQRETGDPIMRAGLVVDWSDHSYYCNGSVPQGSKVRFSLPPDFDAIEKSIKGCEELKAIEIPEADAILLFNCGGRLLTLGPLISEEIEGIKNTWNAPIAGMFSNAELARATNGNLEMHAFTACTVALKER